MYVIMLLKNDEPESKWRTVPQTLIYVRNT